MKRFQFSTHPNRMLPAEHFMQDNPQTVQVGPAISLSLTFILFWRSVAWRTKFSRIVHLARLEIAGNAKVYQHDPSIGREDDVCRLEITEDHGWCLLMQV